MINDYYRSVWFLKILKKIAGSLLAFKNNKLEISHTVNELIK